MQAAASLSQWLRESKLTMSQVVLPVLTVLAAGNRWAKWPIGFQATTPLLRAAESPTFKLCTKCHLRAAAVQNQ
jgi:hypothetical protein